METGRTHQSAIFIMYASTLFFSAMGLLVKYLGNSVSSGVTVFYRSFFGVIITGVIFFINRKKITVKNLPGLALRGFLGSVALYSYFKAISLIKLSDAAMLCYTSPIYATLFSILFLKEKWDKWTVFTLTAALIGIMLIIKPGFNYLAIGHIWALASGILSGAAYTSVRHLRKTDSPETIVLAFTLLGSIFFIYAPFVSPVDYNFHTILVLLLIGLCATAAQLLMTYSFKFLPTSTGSVLSLFTVFNITIIAGFLFQETPDIYSVAGGITLIVCSVFLVFHNPQKKNYEYHHCP